MFFTGYRLQLRIKKAFTWHTGKMRNNFKHKHLLVSILSMHSLACSLTSNCYSISVRMLSWASLPRYSSFSLYTWGPFQCFSIFTVGHVLHNLVNVVLFIKEMEYILGKKNISFISFIKHGKGKIEIYLCLQLAGQWTITVGKECSC